MLHEWVCCCAGSKLGANHCAEGAASVVPVSTVSLCVSELLCENSVALTVLLRCCAAVALVDGSVMAPLIAIIRASGKPDSKLAAVKVLKDLTADPACQPPLVDKGAVRAFALHSRAVAASASVWPRDVTADSRAGVAVASG